MRLGISSWTYTWAVGVPGVRPERPLQALDLLDRATELGVHVLQICDNLPLAGLTAAQLSALERRSARLGIAIEVGTRGIEPTNLLAYLHLAEYLHSPILRVVVDTASHHPEEDEIVATIGRLAPEFERAHVCLAIENHDRFKARALVRIVERIGSGHVRICLDTVNSLGALEVPQVVVRTLAPLAVNLHVKDFTIERAQHNLGFVVRGCPVGQGRLDVPWVLRTLRRAGRDPNAILEQWTPAQETLAATIAREEEWAATSIAYLHQLIPA